MKTPANEFGHEVGIELILAHRELVAEGDVGNVVDGRLVRRGTDRSVSTLDAPTPRA
jgi:hypothetical protein